MPYNIDSDHTVKPTLAEMVGKALDVLEKDQKGYFLFVEGNVTSKGKRRCCFSFSKKKKKKLFLNIFREKFPIKNLMRMNAYDLYKYINVIRLST